MVGVYQAAFLKWVKGPVTVLGGLVGTWAYTNIPGIHVFGGSAGATGKWVSGALVFGISSAVTYLAHDQAVLHLVEKTEKEIERTMKAAAAVEPPAKADGVR